MKTGFYILLPFLCLLAVYLMASHPEPQEVPDVVGMSVLEAEERLAEAGFISELIMSQDADVEKMMSLFVYAQREHYQYKGDKVWLWVKNCE